nr:MAG: putative ORF2 polyprotein [Barnaviridae sp.]
MNLSWSMVAGELVRQGSSFWTRILLPSFSKANMVLNNGYATLLSMNDTSRLIMSLVFVLMYVGRSIIRSILFFYVNTVIGIVWCFYKVIEPLVMCFWGGVCIILCTLFYPFVVGYALWRRWQVQGLLMPITPAPVVETSERVLLERILAALNGGRYKESMQSGSPVIPLDVWPSHLISIRNLAGAHVGFGFWTIIKGKHALVSAAHVFAEVALGGSLHANGVSLKLEDFKILVRSSMDVCALEIPATYGSQLKVRKMKIARTPMFGKSVSVYGFIEGIISRTIGVVSGPDSGAFKYKHTASTLPGHCGSPLIIGENQVVGIHIESDAMGFNYALSLDFLVVTQEADNYTDGKYGLRYDQELEFGVREYLVVGSQVDEIMYDKTAWKLEAEAEFDEFLGDDEGALPVKGNWTLKNSAAWDQPYKSRRHREKDSGFQASPVGLGETSTTVGLAQEKKKRLRKRRSRKSANSQQPREKEASTSTPPPGPKSESTEPCSTGPGQRKRQKGSTTPSSSTPAVSAKVPDAPQRPKKKPSPKRSSRQENIQSLLSRISSLEAKLATKDTN